MILKIAAHEKYSDFYVLVPSVVLGVVLDVELGVVPNDIMAQH